MIKECSYCGKSFNARKSSNKLCSRVCSNKFIGLGKRKDVQGQKFGRLTAVKFSHIANTRTMWLAKCDCGTEVLIELNKLTNRKTKSCGCLFQEFLDSYKIPFSERAFNEVLTSYKIHAKHKGREWNLTNNEVKLLISQPCFYCGIVNSNCKKLKDKKECFYYNGIDRIDNSKSYEQGNVVSCCGVCNRAKHAMTQTDFLNWVKRVYEHSF